MCVEAHTPSPAFDFAATLHAKDLPGFRPVT